MASESEIGMKERVITDPEEIERLLAQDLPLRASGESDECEFVVGWVADSAQAEVSSFISRTTRKLLELYKLGVFKVTRLYVTTEGEKRPAIIGVEGELPVQLVFPRRPWGKSKAKAKEEAEEPELAPVTA